MTKIIFWGTPNFVLPIPQALLSAEGCQLLAVVTNPDRPFGRKQILTPSPIKIWALEQQIKIIDSSSIIRIIEQIRDIKPDLGILAAYGKIIPQTLIDLFPKGILVIHPSLLPQYRGASPVQAAIAAGEKITGVSIIKMDKQMDHGPIVAQFEEEIKPDETAETLYQRLFHLTAQFLPFLLFRYINFCADRHAKRDIKETPRIDRKLAVFLPPKDQNHEKATFTKILKKEDGFIDLENPPTPEILARLICAYHPWPGVWSKWKMENARPPGFARRSGRGKWKIIKFLPGEKIQLEGGKPMNLPDFLNGYPEAKEWLSKLFPAL